MARKKRKIIEYYVDEGTLSMPEITIDTMAKPPKLQQLPDPEDRRTGQRFLIEFETIVFNQGNSFRTKTVNVSISGALLAENIPADFVDKNLDIVMIRHNGRVRDYYLVKGFALGAPLRSPRIKFTHVPPIQRRKLELLFRNLPIAA